MLRRITWMWCALAATSMLRAEQVRGKVVDARGGEPLAKVQVRLTGTQYTGASDANGNFVLDGVSPGEYTLTVTTVGYRLERRSFQLAAGETKEFEIVLSAGNDERRESVEVHAQVFDTGTEASPTALSLSANDLKNLGSVLTDDPLRAVQGLPGVSSSDDFEAKFEIHGADFTRVGIYLDGILLHNPLHTIVSQDTAGSASAINGDTIAEMNLFEGAFPSRFGDRSAAALEIVPRDGSRTEPSIRISAGMSYSGVVVEGPLGKSKKLSYLVSFRKSYLQYLANRISAESSWVFGLQDEQARLSYDLTPHNNISLNFLDSFTALNRSSVSSTLGINSLLDGQYHFTLANLNWRYTPNAKLIWTNRSAWMREKHDDLNKNSQSLETGHYGEWVGDSALKWAWKEGSPLSAGYTAREVRDAGTYDSFNQPTTAAPIALQLLERHDGTTLRSGAYVQQDWSAWGGRLHASAGGRWDYQTLGRKGTMSPQAAATLNVTHTTFLQLSWGQYVQYQEVGVLTSNLGSKYLLPTRSIHAVAAIEQSLGSRARLRAEYYEREDRDLLNQPTADPRLIGTTVFVPPLYPLYANSMRGYSRGFGIFLERRTANRLSGWVSYGYGRTGERDGVQNLHYVSDWDQRHTFTVFASWRVRPTVNLSVRSVAASAFPMPEFILPSGSGYVLATSRNLTRLPAYERTDLRINKTWTKVHWKTTLFGEVVNITNRNNQRFDSFDGYTTTGTARITLDTMFPILPAVGLVLER